jgi:hypothetical protein
MKNYSRENSKLLINHSLSAYTSGGKDKTQAKFAVEHGLETSRISEAKKGIGRINDEILNELEEKYGFPRRGKGLYVHAETYLTLEEFLATYNEVTDQRHCNHMEHLCKENDFKEIITGNFNNGNMSCSENEEISILERLDVLLDSEELGAWYEYEISNTQINPNITTISSLLHKHGFSSISFSEDKNKAQILFRLAHYKYNLCPDFKLSSKPIKSTEIKNELVICGDIIINEEILAQPFLDQIQSPSEINYLGTVINVNLPDFSVMPRINYNHSHTAYDNWEKISLKIVLTPSLKYHLVINFLSEYSKSSSGKDRNIVIKDLGKINFLNELVKIIDTFALNTIDIENIKSELALLGACIPGAKVLD